MPPPSGRGYLPGRPDPHPFRPDDISVDVPPKTAPRLFLIDAYALIYRAYFAFIQRPLTNSRGENTSAPFGFVNFLIQIREKYEPDYLAVVFDAGMSQREVEYPAYKATREKMPDDLRDSLPRVRALVEAFHDPVVAVEGYEADDVIGTLARQARERGVEAVVVSGDKDFYQLVGPGVHLLNPGRGGPTGVAADWVDERNAGEKFGLPPSQVIDYLALIGDSSDNVPGAPGIGPKTAVALLQEFGSVEALLERAGEISGKRARESLQENAEQVRLSKRLVTIQTDVPVELDLEAWTLQEPDRARLREVLAELEFRTLIDKYAAPGATVAGSAPRGAKEWAGAGAGAGTGLEAGVGGMEGTAPEAQRAPTHYRLLTTTADVDALVARIRERGEMSVDTETTDLDPMRARLVGVAVSLERGEGSYLPFRHRAPVEELELELEDRTDESIPNLPSLSSPEMAGLRGVLQDPGIRKVGHNLKYDRIVLEQEGVGLEGLHFDTMVASYLVDPARRQHNLDDLAIDHLGLRTTTYEEVAGKGRRQVPFAEVPLEAARDYACEDTDVALRLREHFLPILKANELEPLFHALEMPLVPILARMERNGIRIDPAVFGEMNRRLERELAQIQHDIHVEAGGEFNINSVPQLREILFDRLKLPVIKKTKTGASTDSDVLEALAGQGHRICGLMIEYRELEKLRNTYVDALPRMVNPGTGRIHTSFNQTVAQTGRLSSSDPNLQNIPIRTALGREIRRGFVADEGTVFLAADYSQVELRILAHFSGDEAFVTAFREGIDIHRQTASVMFDVPIGEVSGDQRGQAKTVNFGILYGQGEFSLGNQLGIGREAAKRFIEEYFERFPGVRSYLDVQVERARERGYVETLAGRRRYIPELKSKNWNVRQFGERVAQNTPIQGTAADLIKKAMLGVQAVLDGEGWGGRADDGPGSAGGAAAVTGAGSGTEAAGGGRHRREPARLLLQVHDELLFEVDEGRVEALREVVVERMESAMTLSVPLRVDVGIGKSWYDAKG